MWYDSLHPSEQTNRIIAREFIDIVTGNGIWGQTWTSTAAATNNNTAVVVGLDCCKDSVLSVAR